MEQLKILRGRPRRLTDREAMEIATDSGNHQSIICPCCGSGSGEHGTGLFRNTDEKKQHMLHCASCKKTFTYDVQYLNRIYGERKGTPLEIHENINFYKTYKYLKEVRGIDEDILTRFLFSDGDEHRCFIYGYDDNGIKHKQELVYDVSTNELHKYFDKNDSNFFYTEIIVDTESDVFFIVESVTNALSIASLGFNSVVIYTATNIDKFALSYILTKKKLNKTILCLDFDKMAVMEKYETLNYRIFDFSRFEEFLDNPKLDINDLFLQCKEKLSNYLNELKNAKIEKETNTELACEEIESLIDLNKNNCVIIPTGAGKTHYITKQLKEDKNAISFHPTIENVDEMAEQGVNTITHDGEKYNSSEVGQSMCYARPKLELDNETYEVKSHNGGTEDQIKNKICYLDEVDKSLEQVNIPFIRMFRLKEKKFFNQSDKKRVYMTSVYHDNSKIISGVQENGYVFYIDFYFEKNKDCQYNNFKQRILIGDREYTLSELINPQSYVRDPNPKCNEYYLRLAPLKPYKKTSPTESFDELVRKRHNYFLINPNYFMDLEAFLNWQLEFLAYAEIHATFPEVYDENGNIKALNWEEYQEAIKNPATRWANVKNHSEWFSVKLRGISTQVLQRILFNCKTAQMFTASNNPIINELLTELGKYYNFDIKHSNTNYLINVLFNIYLCPKTIGNTELKKWAEQLEQRGEKMVIVARTKETAMKKARECAKFINTSSTNESNLFAFDCENSNGLIIFSYPDSPFMRGSNKFRDVKYCLIDSEIFFPINSVGWYEYPSDEMAVQNGITLLLQILGRLCRTAKDGVKMLKKIGLYNFSTNNDYNILMGQAIANELKKLKIEYEFKSAFTKESLLISFFSNELVLIEPHVESVDFEELQKKKAEEAQVDVRQNEIKKERFFEKYYEVPDSELVFFDTEVYKNLFILVTKRHADKNCKAYVNPPLKVLEEIIHPFCKYWIGYNNNFYDNLILYKLKKLLKSNQNYSVIMPELKKFSDGIINKYDKSIEYGKITTYLDFYKLCPKDKSLSKLKYELNYPCLETPYSFDVDIQPEQIDECVNYCVNDVLGLEYAFFQPQYYQKYLAHKSLCKMVDIQVSNSTNTTTGVLIFGHTSNLWRKSQLKLPNLTEYMQNIPGYENAKFEVIPGETNITGRFINGNTSYDINRGGENKTVPGKHTNVVSLDVDSMYVTTFINTHYFGDFTERIKQLRDVRLALKRKDLPEVNRLYKEFGEFITNEHIDFKLASDMLKLCLNSLYGLSSASFDNFMKLRENETNLIANLGNIMMNELYQNCISKGWKVVHIKTDGIKIADCTDEMIAYCIDFAKKWGYNFSIDEKYKEFLIIDKANYIGITEDGRISSRGELFNNNWLEAYVNNAFDRETASIILQVKKGVIVNHTKNNTKVGKCIKVYPCVNGDEYYKIMPEKEIFECVADTKKPGRNKDRDVFKFNVYTEFNQTDFDKSYFDSLYNKILLKIGSNKVLNGTKEEADDILRSFFRTETA